MKFHLAEPNSLYLQTPSSLSKTGFEVPVALLNKLLIKNLHHWYRETNVAVAQSFFGEL